MAMIGVEKQPRVNDTNVCQVKILLLKISHTNISLINEQNKHFFQLLVKNA